jgi:hypothetical protein
MVAENIAPQSLTQRRAARTVKSSESEVPSTPGLYAIFVDAPCCLPSPYSEDLLARKTTLIYVGKAGTRLRTRLVEQDLRHRAPSTFFRGIGSVLGYRPIPGSARTPSQAKNYHFSSDDEDAIKSWIDEHLLISWVELRKDEPERIEPGLIRENCPLMNSPHNPHPCEALRRARAECRDVALGKARSSATPSVATSGGARTGKAPATSPGMAGGGHSNPEELARELGISPKTLRVWLRQNESEAHQHGARWLLSAEQAACARERFGRQ